MFATVLTSGSGRAFLTLLLGIRALSPYFLITRKWNEVHVARSSRACVLWCRMWFGICYTHCTVLLGNHLYPSMVVVVMIRN